MTAVAIPDTAREGTTVSQSEPLTRACNLDHGQAHEQVDQRREVLGRTVIRLERPAPCQLRLVLAGTEGDLSEVLGLARAEKACCPFFDFDLHVGTDALTLLISIPAGSESLLDDFASLAPST
jgi:MerR family transcriptional regulator, copper efflux regulator